jgi:hypothetical protein
MPKDRGEDRMTLRKTLLFSNFLLGFLEILGNQEGAPRQDDQIYFIVISLTIDIISIQPKSNIQEP